MWRITSFGGPPGCCMNRNPTHPWQSLVPEKFRAEIVSTKEKNLVVAPRVTCSWFSNCPHSLSSIACKRGFDTYRVPAPYKSSLTSLSYAEMVFATVPDAPPTVRNQRATSCPAPISAKEPNTSAFRLIDRAFWCVPSFSGVSIPPPAGHRLYHFEDAFRTIEHCQPIDQAFIRLRLSRRPSPGITLPRFYNADAVVGEF